MEDDGVSFSHFLIFIVYQMHTQVLSHIKQMMDRRDQSLLDIVKTLQVYHDNVEEEDVTMSEDSPVSQKDILQHLMEFLRGS